MIHWIINAFRHFTGADDGSGAWYLFESGFVGDLMYLSVLGVLYRHVNCHVDGCKALGFHHVPGTNFKVCRKHHPTGGNTVEHIHAAHARAQEQ